MLSAAALLGWNGLPVPRVARPFRGAVHMAVETPTDTHATVIFLRHGQSTWNEASLFTGWADVELTTLGKNEAAAAATALWREGYALDLAFSSRLKRAIRSTSEMNPRSHAHANLSPRIRPFTPRLIARDSIDCIG